MFSLTESQNELHMPKTGVGEDTSSSICSCSYTNATNGYILTVGGNCLPLSVGANISQLWAAYKVIFQAYFFFSLSVFIDVESISLTPQKRFIKTNIPLLE